MTTNEPAAAAPTTALAIADPTWLKDWANRLAAWTSDADAHFTRRLLDDYLAGKEVRITTSGTILQGVPVVYSPNGPSDRFPWVAITGSEATTGWRYGTMEVDVASA